MTADPLAGIRPKAHSGIASIKAGARAEGAANLKERQRSRLRSLLRQVEQEGARLQFWTSTLAICAVGIFLAAAHEWDGRLGFTEAVLCVFVLIGFANYRLALRSRKPVWVGFVTGTLQIVFLTWFLIAPNPFAEEPMPPAMALRQGGFQYLIILICLGALTLSVRLAAWLGISAALSWSLAVIWVVTQPGTITALGSELPHAEWMRLYLSPNFVDLTSQTAHVVVMLIIGAIIATVVLRSGRLAEAYTTAERARFNLSRHFSPNVVDQLATADEPFGPVRRQEIGVVFADIVGFTTYAEDHPAEDVFELLREFHRRMEQVVFDHGGTVDNYIGDAIMATFGMPQPEADDAARAIQCSRAMRETIRAWNAQIARRGGHRVEISVGCHYGPVVLGAIGSERNLSFAVVGDTVNVASRLQTACRELGADICIGAAAADAAARAGRSDVLAGAVDYGEVVLRGRDHPVHVWIVPKP